MRILLCSVWMLIMIYGCGNNASSPASITSKNIQEQYKLLEAEAGFQIKEGYQIQLIAAEPLIEAPVAMDWDRKGRLWVLEMPDYMPDIDGVDEHIPRGRIVILEDKDGDGRMDHTKTFLDGLHQPRALALLYGGLLYAESPYLYFTEIDGDRPGKTTIVDSLYATGGNVEHQPNGLMLNVDNWIYNAKSNYRYRKVEDKWLKEPTAFRGQWGITHDAWGRVYTNDNSNGLYGDHVLPCTATAHEYYQPTAAVNRDILGTRRIYPAHSTAINRGYAGNLDAEGKVENMTSTCGPMVSLGSLAHGDAFISVPEGNLIKQVSLSYEDGRNTAQNVYQESEFLTAMDEAFRPVNMQTGTDDAIYVADFHRGVIQHKTYMTSYLREQLLQRGLDKVVGMGRIWKIIADEKSTKRQTAMADQSLEELVANITHPNGAQRLRAQHELIHRNDESCITALTKIALSDNPLGQLHALYALEGMKVDLTQILSQLNKVIDPGLAAHIIKLAEERSSQKVLQQLVATYMMQKDTEIDLQVAHSLGRLIAFDEASTMDKYKVLLSRYPDDEVLVDMVLSGIQGNEEAFAYGIRAINNTLLKDQLTKLKTIISNNRKVGIHQPPRDVGIAGKTKGLALFGTHCGACHGAGGNGIQGLAPSLYGAAIVDSDISKLGLMLYTGLTGPVHIEGTEERYNATMPGLLANRELSTDDVASIINYVSNAFSKTPSTISVAEVEYLKEVAKTYTTIPTEVEILEFKSVKSGELHIDQTLPHH